ncbi:MAG: hypothetical protein NWP47_05000 [Rickettsiaceae bacterium]|nr:hypothetical protein [Rickettsiaceae bacterium]
MKYKIRKIEKRYKQNLKNSEEKIILLEKSIVQLSNLANINWSKNDENIYRLRSFKGRLSSIGWKKVIINNFDKFIFFLLLLSLVLIMCYDYAVLHGAQIGFVFLLISLFLIPIIACEQFSIFLVIKQKLRKQNAYRNSFLRIFSLYFSEFIKFFLLPFLKKIIKIIVVSCVAYISFYGIFLLYMNTQFWTELSKLDFSNLSRLFYMEENGFGTLILIVFIFSIITLLALGFSIVQALRFHHIKWKYLSIKDYIMIGIQGLCFIAAFIFLVLGKYKNILMLSNISFSVFTVLIYTAAVILMDELSVEKKFRRKNRDLIQTCLENKS